jgi:murein DD-endopeptidase MepM/ murein hydrolase activator NlpD
MTTFFAQRHPSGISRKARLIFGVFLLAAVGAGTGAAGFWYGQLKSGIGAETGQTAAMLASMFERERSTLQEAKQEYVSHLDAVAAKLGQMQAEMLRLNALGERLVEMAGLSEEEFDFENPPAVGGPEPVEAVENGAADLVEEMNGLLAELNDRDGKLALLEELIMEKDLQEQSNPTARPVRSGFVTSNFGYRTDPMTGKRSLHRGVDFAGKRGSDILAVADGLVILSEGRSGYGRTVEIRHANGLVTRYAHNQKLLVKVGDLVEKGQVIAKLGSSGRATGPHLHFEVLKDGQQVNPMEFAGMKKRANKG